MQTGERTARSMVVSLTPINTSRSSLICTRCLHCRSTFNDRWVLAVMLDFLLGLQRGTRHPRARILGSPLRPTGSNWRRSCPLLSSFITTPQRNFFKGHYLILRRVSRKCTMCLNSCNNLVTIITPLQLCISKISNCSLVQK